MEPQSLEVWVQTGIPDKGELVFNVHCRNVSAIEWEVSYRLSEFGALDRSIASQSDALRDVAFPLLNKDTVNSIVNGGAGAKAKMKDLERCRASLEKWVYYVVTRIEFYPPPVVAEVESFFCLPNGPIGQSGAIGGTLPSSVTESAMGGEETKYDDSSEHNDAEDGDSVAASSVITAGGTRVKKKKRILKGAKKRISRMFSSREETDANGSARSVDSSIMGVSESESSTTSAFHLPPGTLMRGRVVRGADRKRGQPEYEVQLISAPNTPPHCAVHIFDGFVDLQQAIAGVGLTAPFPQSHAKSALGIALTEEQQSERTRQLDAWTKEFLAAYQGMGDKQRAAVRQFLKLDLTTPKDIQIQDKLANGLVEAPRAAHSAQTGVLKPSQAESVFVDTSSQGSGKPPRGADDSSGSGSRGVVPTSPVSIGPGSKVSGSVTSTASGSHRRTSYAVKISQSSGSISSEPTRLKPDLKDMTGTPYYGESAMGSSSSQNSSRLQVDGRKKDNLSTDEVKSNASPQPVDDKDMLQENLLRIGTTKPEKKKKNRFLCCFYR